MKHNANLETRSCNLIEVCRDDWSGQFSVKQVIFDTKYSGYVDRQQVSIDRQKRMAEKRIPPDFDYEGMSHLRREAKEKLARFRPTNIDQAQRISGITPADIAQLMLHLGGKPNRPKTKPVAKSQTEA